MLAISSCSADTKYDILKDYFSDTHKYEGLVSMEAVVVIQSTGGCLPCSRRYAEFISSYQTNPKLLFLILASGTEIDISNFHKEKENVYYDLKKEFSKLKFLEKSGLILLENSQIDTILEINVTSSDEIFDFISTTFKHE